MPVHPVTGDCTEICGDGLDFGQYECDNGWAVDPTVSGCDEDCNVETGFACFDGTPTTPDVCIDS